MCTSLEAYDELPGTPGGFKSWQVNQRVRGGLLKQTGYHNKQPTSAKDLQIKCKIII